MMLPPISQQHSDTKQTVSSSNRSKHPVLNPGTADFSGIQDIKRQLKTEITNDLLKRITNQIPASDSLSDAWDNRTYPSVSRAQESGGSTRSNMGANDFRSITTIIYEILSLLEILICDGNGGTNPDLLNMCVNIKKRLALQCSNVNSLLGIDKIYSQQQITRKRQRSHEKSGFRASHYRNINDSNSIQHQTVDEANQRLQQELIAEDKEEFAHNPVNKFRRIDKLLSNHNELSKCRGKNPDALFTKALNVAHNNNSQNLDQELTFANDQFLLNINGLNNNLSNLEKLWIDSNRNNSNMTNENDNHNQISQLKNQIQFSNSSNFQSFNQTNNSNSLRVENLISKESLDLADNESGNLDINDTTSSSGTDAHNTGMTIHNNPDAISATGDLNNNFDKVSINNILNEGTSLYQPVENIRDHIIANRNSGIYCSQLQAGKPKKKKLNDVKSNYVYNRNGDSKGSISTANSNTSLTSTMMIPSIASSTEADTENHSSSGNITGNNTSEIFSLAPNTTTGNEESENLLKQCVAPTNNNNETGSVNKMAFTNMNDKIIDKTASTSLAESSSTSGDTASVSNNQTNKYISINELLKERGKRGIEEGNEDDATDENNEISMQVLGSTSSNSKNSSNYPVVLSTSLQTNRNPPTSSTDLTSRNAELQFPGSTVINEQNTKKQVGFTPMYDFIKTDSLKTILFEYFYGIGENMSIKQMEQEFGTRWRGGSKHSMSKTFNRRKNLYKIAEILLSRPNFQIQDVIERLESARRFSSVNGEVTEKKSLAWLCNNISLEMIDESKYIE